MRIKSLVESYNLGFHVSKISARGTFCISQRALISRMLYFQVPQYQKSQRDAQ